MNISLPYQPSYSIDPGHPRPRPFWSISRRMVWSNMSYLFWQSGNVLERKVAPLPWIRDAEETRPTWRRGMASPGRPPSCSIFQGASEMVPTIGLEIWRQNYCLGLHDRLLWRGFRSYFLIFIWVLLIYPNTQFRFEDSYIVGLILKPRFCSIFIQFVVLTNLM